MKKLTISLCLLIFAFSTFSFAQIRPAEKEDVKEETKKEENKEAKKEETKEKEQKIDIKDLPKSFKVKYMGGLFGFNKNQKGSIGFDDINERMIFYGKDGKEKFSIPYGAMLVVYPNPKKVRAGSGRVIGAVPVIGAGVLGSLIKKKKNYLVIKFKDPDVNAEGNINFLLSSPDLVATAITSIGERAEMKRRGDSYLRLKDF